VGAVWETSSCPCLDRCLGPTVMVRELFVCFLPIQCLVLQSNFAGAEQVLLGAAGVLG
jgi:hypothetical protein